MSSGFLANVDVSAWQVVGEASNMRFYAPEPRIVVGKATDKTSDTAETAREKIALMDAYATKHGRFVAIVSMDGFIAQDAGARRVYTTSGNPLAPFGMCLVSHSLLGRAMVSIFLGLKKPPFPLKVGASFEEALVWARGLLAENVGG